MTAKLSIIGLIVSLCLVGLPLPEEANPQSAATGSAPTAGTETKPAKPQGKVLDFKRLKQRFEKLPLEKQLQLQKQFAHFMEQPPAKRKELVKNYTKFMQLSATDRKLVNRRYKQLTRLTRGKKEKVAKAYDWFKGLDPQMQKQLKALLAEMKTYLPNDLARLQRLAKRKDNQTELQTHLRQVRRRLATIQQLPETEREKLREMTPEQRQKYIKNLQKVPKATPKKPSATTSTVNTNK